MKSAQTMTTVQRAHLRVARHLEAKRARSSKPSHDAAYWLRTYGMTPGQYIELMARQRCRCAVCNRRFGFNAVPVIDHVHRMHREQCVVRGLLCQRCNSGIGYFNDSPSLLDAAKAYLQSPPARDMKIRPGRDRNYAHTSKAAG